MSHVMYEVSYYIHKQPDQCRSCIPYVDKPMKQTPEPNFSSAFRGRLAVAAHNSQASITLSGDIDAVILAKKVFDEEKKFARLLKVDTAYHSHHMLPCGKPYVDALQACRTGFALGCNLNILSKVEQRPTVALDLITYKVVKIIILLSVS